MKFPWHRWMLSLFYLGALGSMAWLVVEAAPYYLTPLIERPRHPLFWRYKPGGELGRAFGWLGSGMMTLMLAYSLRKRVGFMRHWGPIHVWLDYHIFLGICGPLLIVLHSSFKVRGLVSLSFWSMVAVMLSGILGRYIYRWIPRSGSGDELSLTEVKKLDEALSSELRQQWGLSGHGLRQLEASLGFDQLPSRSLGMAFIGLFVDPISARLRLYRGFRMSGLHEGGGLDGTGPGSLGQVLKRKNGAGLRKLLLKKALMRRRLALWDHVHSIFHYWHVFHKPFAVIMYLFMMVHIAVAWSTGYGWVGS